MSNFNIKSKEDIEELNDKRLLSYYKAERKRFYTFISSISCGCCGERLYHIYTKYSKYEKEEDEYREYLDSIKEILNTRGHVE